MSDSFVLPKETLKNIFKEKILNDPKIAFDQVASVSNPKGIILAGQPGAGKSAVMRQALADFGKEGAIVLDPDELRRFHPDIDNLKKKYPTDWASHTQGAASEWTKMLKKEALKGRKNVILDGTLSSSKGALDTYQSLSKKNYTTEVRALSVHKLESDHGVYSRFQSSFEKEGTGRWVPSEIREKAYKGMPESLDALEKKGVPVKIYDRGGKEIYSGNPSGGAKSTILKHREKYIATPEKSKEVADNWKKETHSLSNARVTD